MNCLSYPSLKLLGLDSLLGDGVLPLSFLIRTFRPCLDWVHQDNELTRGVSSHLQRTRILPTPYRVEAFPSTGKTTEPYRRHPHPDSARGFLPYEYEGDEEERKTICTH